MATQQLHSLAYQLQTARYADLSPQIHSNMPNWSSHPHVLVAHEGRTHLTGGHYCQLFVVPERTSSRIDASHHVNADLPDKTIDSFTGDTLITRVRKADVTSLDPPPQERSTHPQTITYRRNLLETSDHQSDSSSRALIALYVPCSSQTGTTTKPRIEGNDR